MKKFLLIFLTILMVITMLPISALAADLADEITIEIRIFDLEKNLIYEDVATDTATKAGSGWLAEPYVIPELSKFVPAGSTYGRVDHVAGNWGFPASQDQQVGVSVQFSNNSSNAAITYWVYGYTPAAGGGSTGGSTPSNPGSGVIDLGGGSGNLCTFTVRYHANYPEGDTVISQKYQIRTYGSYTNIVNLFSSDIPKHFYSYSALNFGGYTCKETETTWYKDAACESKWTGVGVTNGAVFDFYAGWDIPAPGPTPEERDVYTLTCMNGETTFYTVKVLSGEQTALPACDAVNEGYAWVGWSAAENSTSAEWKAGDLITLHADTTVYAVWEANTYHVRYEDGISIDDPNANEAEMPEAATYESGEVIQLPVPTRTNDLDWTYEFMGWTCGDGNLYRGTYTVTEDVTFTATWRLKTISGDLYVDVLDAMITMEYLAGDELHPDQKAVADYNGDGLVDVRDAMVIMEDLAGE